MKKNKKLKKEASIVADIKGYLGNSKEKANRKNGKLPWYLDKAKQIKHDLKESVRMIFEEESEEGGRLNFSNKKKNKSSWKEKALTKYRHLKDQIQNLEKRVAKGRKTGSLDMGPEKQLKSLKGQLSTLAKAVKKGGKDWERYMVDPNATEKSANRQKEKETSKEKKEPRTGSNEEILKAINNYLNLDTSKVSGQDEKVKNSIDNLLKTYAGKTKSSPQDFKKISDWVENKFWPASGYDIPSFVKKKSSNWQNLKLQNLPDELKSKVTDALSQLGSKKDPSDSWQKWEQLPKDLQGEISNWYADNADKVKTNFKSVQKTTPAPTMKAKRSKSGDLGRVGTFDKKEIPGGTKKIDNLASKLNKANPKDEPHTAPKRDPQGKKLYPGTAATELGKGYEKVGDEVIYGKHGLFDEIVDEIQKRNPNFKVHSILNRYLEIEDQLDPGSNDIEILKKKFSKDELKILSDIAAKTDPSQFSDVPDDGYSEFEKAIAPTVRGDFQRKGHELKGEDEEDVHSSSGANTKELKLVWSQMLKTPISDIDDKLTALKKNDPESFNELENRAMGMLQGTFPDAYKSEIAAREFKAKQNSQNNTKEQITNKALDNLISSLKNPDHRDGVIRAFKRATDDKHKVSQIIQNANDPDAILQIIKTNKEEPKDDHDDVVSGLKRAEKRMASSSEPRNLSPEEIEKRKQMGAHAASISALNKSKKKKVQPNTSKINAILQRRAEQDKEENKMASNESKKLSLKKVFEAFDNSYKLDPEFEEGSWESEAPVETKDWEKELSLSDMINGAKKKKPKKKAKSDEKEETFALVDISDFSKPKKVKK